MNNPLKDCTGVVLAGGENTRMPVLKAFIEVCGESIIQRNIRIMERLFREVFIVTNQPEVYSSLNTLMLGDVYDIRGPMTGIFTALLNSSNKWIFVSACDMPFINEQLIQFMASKRENHDAVLPESFLPSPPPHSGGQKGRKRRATEPLFAFYSTKLLKPFEGALLGGSRSLKDFLDNKRVKYITKKEINNFDAAAESFINLNTPQDIDRFLQPEDISKYRSNAGRRGTWLV